MVKRITGRPRNFTLGMRPIFFSSVMTWDYLHRAKSQKILVLRVFGF